MKAFVLCGGSIKGAFQAGAIAHVLRAGFKPDLICGISVGSLNGAFLADRAGRMEKKNRQVNWSKLADDLEDFWKSRVKKPSDLAKERSLKQLAEAIGNKTFDGLAETDPLCKLVKKEVDVDNLKRSPIRLKVGAVNLLSGKLAYTDTGDPLYVAAGFPDFHNYVMASTAIPFAMPSVRIGEGVFVDGGVRDIAPIGEALKSGADEIVCVACHPAEERNAIDDDANLGNFMTYADRVQGIISREILANDLKTLDLINRVVDLADTLEGLFPGDIERLKGTFAALRRLAGISSKRHIEKPILIAPEFFLNYDILNFKSADISEMLAKGKKRAISALQSKTWDS